MTVIDGKHRGDIGTIGGRLTSTYRTLCELFERFPLAVIQLAMRIAVGTVFLKSGLLKLNSWEFAIKLFEDEYKVPVLSPSFAAVLATFNEFTFSILIIIGLATRIATLPLLGMVIVIQIFVYPQAWPEHLLWASILLFLLTRGPGALSIDHSIARWTDGHTMPR
jgi:putative oxidoreductase